MPSIIDLADLQDRVSTMNRCPKTFEPGQLQALALVALAERTEDVESQLARIARSLEQIAQAVAPLTASGIFK